MTTPTWTPTPEGQIPGADAVLALFADLPPGNITAADMRALTQAVFSAVHWISGTLDVIDQQVIDLATVASSLVSGQAAIEARLDALEAAP